MDISPPSGIKYKATPEGPPSLKWHEVMPLHKMLSQSHQEVFGHSSLVRETREGYFRSHCPKLNNQNSHDFTDIFWCMTETASLLGSAIYEIKEAWTGCDELQQANYVLRTLLKGLKFFRVVSPSESPKVMGLMGIHNLEVLHCFNGWPTAPGVGKGVKTRAPLSTTFRQCITSWASYVRNISAAHPSHQRPSATRAGRTANPQRREVLTSHPHPHNY